MIRVRVHTGVQGWLTSVDAVGHAQKGQSSESVACAVASALLRSTSSLLEQTDGVQFRSDAPEAGRLWMELQSVRDDRTERAATITDFLVEGLRALAADFPNEIDVRHARAKGWIDGS